MATFDGWENAFVAMSVALGVPVDETRASLEGAALARAEPLIRRLGGGTREGRARALASGIAHIAIAIEKTRLS